MAGLQDQVRRLRQFNGALGDQQGVPDEELRAQLTSDETLESADQAFDFESIVLRKKRPVLAIRDDTAKLEFDDPEEEQIWRQPLEDARELLRDASRSVGRIDLRNHEDFDWVGTGWLIDPGIMVTNRHVATTFVEGAPLAFRTGPLGRVDASIDFLREFGNDARRTFRIVKPLHVESPGGPDLAFFEVELTSASGELTSPIDVAPELRDEATSAVVIGYPAFDSRIPDHALMQRIYGDRYDKKRLAPGEVTRVEAGQILHNCTTLGGNSGSVVLDLKSGRALGLHFSGRFLSSNFAVRADTVRARLDDVRRGLSRERSAPSQPPKGGDASARAMPRRVTSVRAPPPPPSDRRRGGETTTLTVPLTITVSLGGATTRAASRRSATRRPCVTIEDHVAEEAKPADYRQRDGYLAAFLGEGFAVPLPTVERDEHDVVTFDDRGKVESELRYEHFSVVMSESRRMCIYSAVNIDGGESRKTKRAGWRTDPRIPKNQQILNECYGPPPKFSRGHMTRREDPAWGDVATAARGNVDSMHVTNTTPQMQAFNSPIWLELENYALQNARTDDMKISVFTGPYFDYDGVEDPVIDGVRIPRVFWKIIAFVHDESGELCATGYEMSQEDNLPQSEEEFVFGDFVSSHVNRSSQVTIASIESRAGLSFGRLADIDPLAKADEAIDVAMPLERLEEIRFR